jgi:hypothetical protein
MPYRISLRSRTDGRITGWYDGSDGRWSTDRTRQKHFDNKRDARRVCFEPSLPEVVPPMCQIAGH